MCDQLFSSTNSKSVVEMKLSSSSVVFIFIGIYDLIECGKLKNEVLSRARRYLAFPSGASAVIHPEELISSVDNSWGSIGNIRGVEICLAAQTYIYRPTIFTDHVGWGLAYELPNGSKPFLDFYLPNYLKRRRNRRDLYKKMETIMNSVGYNGRDCVLRSLCEASYRFLPKEDNLANLILKIVFRYPMEQLLPTEPDEHRIYHWASRLGHENKNCIEQFNCPFSLIDMALGNYMHSHQ